MDLVTVGTGTVAPSATRTSACHWVGRGNLKILLDCGAGALHHLALFGPGFPVGVLAVQAGEPFPLDAEVSLETHPVPHTPESVALSLTAPEGRLVYTGDTGPSKELARWAAGADLLLAECSLPKEMATDMHLTPEQAGDLARKAGARHLVLTHFYPPVETTDPARAARQRFTGRVTAARDGDRFTIGGGRGGK